MPASIKHENIGKTLPVYAMKGTISKGAGVRQSHWCNRALLTSKTRWQIKDASRGCVQVMRCSYHDPDAASEDEERSKTRRSGPSLKDTIVAKLSLMSACISRRAGHEAHGNMCWVALSRQRTVGAS
eukprot:scaffold18692_cov24-Tisochrysis_lutea.AAC.1